VINTSTAILCRLFVKYEGAGNLMASAPLGMRDLIERISSDGIKTVKVKAEMRGFFAISEEAKWFVDSLLCIGSGALVRDSSSLREMLNRVALSGLETRALSALEMSYLQAHVEHGHWCSGLLIEGPRV
jgi:hypothetical protein